ncbi:hypothetical protein CROQUDRAFT_101308 [Cronartium quercuum f. sp. fusiforme G11]|uniref:Uncharacterized protein n=1 Tax=Cronartium quercuum f. sp. fusiforme G11 TaxID=708437 RepID=A0A9P6N8X6_9BASI|nr:hypothetical protein CROQUDRAFT_101308 [Cronartium quercuum f. sp. fusiforme G11]
MKPAQVVQLAFLRLASICIYSKPTKDRKTCQWLVIDQTLLKFKQARSLDYEEA